MSDTSWWASVIFFKQHEFDSPDIVGSGALMDREAVMLFDAIRAAVGKPLHVNSGYRTKAYNALVRKAKPDSAHTRGMAADLEALTSSLRFKIVRVALALGAKRIGVAETYVHIDADKTLPQNVLWLY